MRKKIINLFLMFLVCNNSSGFRLLRPLALAIRRCSNKRILGLSQKESDFIMSTYQHYNEAYKPKLLGSVSVADCPNYGGLVDVDFKPSIIFHICKGERVDGLCPCERGIKFKS